MDHLSSCKELHRLLSNSFGGNACRLTFAPDQLGVDTRFFLSDDGNSVEIVCFKSTYLLVFKEAHNYFNQFQPLSGMFSLAILQEQSIHFTYYSFHPSMPQKLGDLLFFSRIFIDDSRKQN